MSEVANEVSSDLQEWFGGIDSRRQAAGSRRQKAGGRRRKEGRKQGAVGRR